MFTNTLKTAMLMSVMTMILVLAGSALGGRGGMQMAFMIALVMNFFSYWFSDKIVLKMYRAKEIKREENPDLFSMVEKLTQAAGIPMPKLYVTPQNVPNAFATGRNPNHAAIAVTSGITQLLSHDELEGVLAHEISHIRNRDILIGTLAATMAGAITMLARIAQWGLIFGGMGGRRNDRDRSGSGIGVIVMMIIAPIAAMLVQMAISRSREYRADYTGAKICGRPLGLASALQKLEDYSIRMPMEAANPSTAHMFIVNPFKGKDFLSLFSTHPPIAERIKRLREMDAEK